MNYEKASSDLKRYLPLKIATFIWFAAVFGVGAYLVAATWNEWWPYPDLDIDGLDDAKPAIYSFAGGLLGAAVFAFRGFYQSVGPQNPQNPRYQYDPNWTLWYISRPIMGAFLGAFSYAVLRGGVATFGGAASSSAGPHAAYFAVAFLAGFSVTEVLDWTHAAARRIFNAEALRGRPSNTTHSEHREDSDDG